MTARFVLIVPVRRLAQIGGMLIRAPIANAVLLSVVLTAIAGLAVTIAGG